MIAARKGPEVPTRLIDEVDHDLVRGCVLHERTGSDRELTTGEGTEDALAHDPEAPSAPSSHEPVTGPAVVLSVHPPAMRSQETKAARHVNGAVRDRLVQQRGIERRSWEHLEDVAALERHARLSSVSSNTAVLDVVRGPWAERPTCFSAASA